MNKTKKKTTHRAKLDETVLITANLLKTNVVALLWLGCK